MSVTLSLSMQGYSYQNSQWVQSSTCTVGGNGMTAFTFTASKNFSSITLSIKMNGDTPNCKYSLTMPETRASAGESINLTTAFTSFTITETFLSGVVYTVWVWGSPTAYYNYGVNSANGTGEEATSGIQVYIWDTVSSEAQEEKQTIQAGSTYRQAEQNTSGGVSHFQLASSILSGNQNIVGIGYNDSSGGALYYSAACIPVSSAAFASQSLTIKSQIYYNSGGVHTFRWAISTLAPGDNSPYADTLSAVSESLQIASGTFTLSYSGSGNKDWEQVFDASIPANTQVYLYLWAYGNNGEKSYGNFHIQSTVTLTLRSVPLSGMGWVQAVPYIHNGTSFVLHNAKLFTGTEWE